MTEKSATQYDSLLHKLESTLHTYAVNEGWCKRYGIKPEQFRVSLVEDCKNHLYVIGGPVVNIILKWPDAQPMMRTLLKRALRYIGTRGLLDTFAKASDVHSLSSSTHFKIWKRHPYDDLIDVAPHVLPSTAFKRTRKHSVTLTHKTTGITHTIHDSTGKRSEWDMEQQCRLEISRIVTEFQNARKAQFIQNRNVALVPISLVVNTRFEVEAYDRLAQEIVGYDAIKEWRNKLTQAVTAVEDMPIFQPAKRGLFANFTRSN